MCMSHELHSSGAEVSEWLPAAQVSPRESQLAYAGAFRAAELDFQREGGSETPKTFQNVAKGEPNGLRSPLRRRPSHEATANQVI